MNDHTNRIRVTPDDVRRAPAVPASSSNHDSGRPAPPTPPDSRSDSRCRRYALPGGSTSLHCPYALVPLRPGTIVAECINCKIVHLEQSWIENGGCTTYGCQSAPTVAQTAAPAAPMHGNQTGHIVVSTRESTGEPVSLQGPIIQIVLGALCLWLPVITGLVGLVYAMKTNEHLAANNYARAMSSRRTAKIWLNIGWVIVICSLGLIVIAIAADA